MYNPRCQSCSSVLVRTGENDSKTLVWMEIFCFVFVAMKTDTFEYALVWVRPYRYRIIGIIVMAYFKFGKQMRMYF